MSCHSSNRVIMKVYRHNFCRFLTVSHNVSNTGCAYHTFYNRLKNENGSYSTCPPKILSKSLGATSSFVYKPCRRNITTQEAIKQFEMFANAPQPKESIPETKSMMFSDLVSPEAIKDAENYPIFEKSNFQSIDFSSIPNFFSSFGENMLVQPLTNYYTLLQAETMYSWGAFFIVAALLQRLTIVLPFAVTQLRLLALQQVVTVKLAKISEKIRKQHGHARAHFGWPDELIAERFKEQMAKERTSLELNQSCQPGKFLILPTIQISTWLTSSVVINKMCTLPESGVSEIYNHLTTGGFAWFTNLTEADPYMVLPVAIGLCNLLTIEIHKLFMIEEFIKNEKNKFRFFQGISVGMIPIAAMLPAGLNLFWLSSSIFGIMQALVLNLPSFRRTVVAPVPVPEMRHPYRFLYKNLKTKLRLQAGEVKSLPRISG